MAVGFHVEGLSTGSRRLCNLKRAGTTVQLLLGTFVLGAVYVRKMGNCIISYVTHVVISIALGADCRKVKVGDTVVRIKRERFPWPTL